MHSYCEKTSTFSIQTRVAGTHVEPSYSHIAGRRSLGTAVPESNIERQQDHSTPPHHKPQQQHYHDYRPPRAKSIFYSCFSAVGLMVALAFVASGV